MRRIILVSCFTEIFNLSLTFESHKTLMIFNPNQVPKVETVYSFALFTFIFIHIFCRVSIISTYY